MVTNSFSGEAEELQGGEGAQGQNVLPTAEPIGPQVQESEGAEEGRERGGRGRRCGCVRARGMRGWGAAGTPTGPATSLRPSKTPGRARGCMDCKQHGMPKALFTVRYKTREKQASASQNISVQHR